MIIILTALAHQWAVYDLVSRITSRRGKVTHLKYISLAICGSSVSGATGCMFKLSARECNSKQPNSVRGNAHTRVVMFLHRINASIPS